ncbi:class I SAM-dependent methyltransferase [Piscirickettsia salmonis]|nr:class I SAM-dependent methyltransferase [Piscirickettsia salmonis]QHS31918.1 class I SAM-dependent methyltransferase [Piscirickettsia salmonis]QIX55333.1 class I SAM-dependent methyltransferase [Piscirickettsia salmonis]
MDAIYMVRHPKCRAAPGLDAYGRPLLPLERFLLEEAPIILATQQRGEIFQKLLQGKMTDYAQFASLPCGLMYDLASLKPALNFKAYGIDLDQAALDLAVKVAQAYSIDAELVCEDAWQLSLSNTLDVLCSNGLTIYEPDDDRVQVFYQKCYQALKPNGCLIVSFLTFPLAYPDSEWVIDEVNVAAAQKQRIVFSDIIGTQFQCYRSYATTYQQLEEVGFSQIEFIDGYARIFPTVVAYKI